MGPVYDQRQPQEESKAVKEPSADTNANSSQPGGQEPAARSRRRSLSDVQTGTDKSQVQPESKSRRPRLTGILRRGSDWTETESQNEPPADGLTNLDVVPAGQERPGRQCMTRMEAAPGQEEPKPQARQPLVAVTEPQVDIVEPPRACRPRLYQNGTIAEPPENAQVRAQAEAARLKQSMAELRAKQNLPMAAVGGLLAAVIGAIIWAAVATATGIVIGYMALGVGFLVGGVVRVFGRGLDKSFGYLGAGMSVFGCLLGNLMTNCMSIAQTTELSVTAVLMHVCKDPAAVPGLMISNFHPLDPVFYGIALYMGYRFSFRRITEAEVASLAAQD